MKAINWNDQLFLERTKKNAWMIVSGSMLIVILALSWTLIKQQDEIERKSRSQRLVLVPAIDRKMVIPAEAHLDDKYIEANMRRVIELNEQWTWESIEGNYKELFENHYSHALQNLTEANLLATGRIDFIKEKRMVSTFKIDREKSVFGWCEKLKRSCSIISGERSLYIEGNMPYQKKRVAYFILGEGIYPDAHNPYAVRISRLVLNETERAYEEALNLYEQAKSGDIDAQ